MREIRSGSVVAVLHKSASDIFLLCVLSVCLLFFVAAYHSRDTVISALFVANGVSLFFMRVLLFFLLA